MLLVCLEWYQILYQPTENKNTQVLTAHIQERKFSLKIHVREIHMETIQSHPISNMGLILEDLSIGKHTYHSNGWRGIRTLRTCTSGPTANTLTKANKNVQGEAKRLVCCRNGLNTCCK